MARSFRRAKSCSPSSNASCAKHPQTTFIGAHCGNNAEDLGEVARWLDAYPNYYVDIDARISELGRQPYTARKFFIKYQDRILFGTDTTPRAQAFRIYYRFLETDDEYFDCAESHHLQGFWMIYGVFLPPEVLGEDLLQERRTRSCLPRPRKARDPSRRAASDARAPCCTCRAPRTSRSPATAAPRPGRSRLGATQQTRPRATRPCPTTRKFKMLYSKTGVYVLFSGSDARLTATMKEDFLDLWNEDVYEFFFWTDERLPLYFEYEISPLGYELPILVPNVDGKFLGWRPWHYEGDRKIQKATAITGGEKKSGASGRRLDRRDLRPLQLLDAAGQRAAQARHALAGQFLSRRLRRRPAHRLGLGSRRPQLSRVPEVRHAGLRYRAPSGYACGCTPSFASIRSARLRERWRSQTAGSLIRPRTSLRCSRRLKPPCCIDDPLELLARIDSQLGEHSGSSRRETAVPVCSTPTASITAISRGRNAAARADRAPSPMRLSRNVGSTANNASREKQRTHHFHKRRIPQHDARPLAQKLDRSPRPPQSPAGQVAARTRSANANRRFTSAVLARMSQSGHQM